MDIIDNTKTAAPIATQNRKQQVARMNTTLGIGFVVIGVLLAALAVVLGAVTGFGIWPAVIGGSVGLPLGIVSMRVWLARQRTQ